LKFICLSVKGYEYISSRIYKRVEIEMHLWGRH